MHGPKSVTASDNGRELREFSRSFAGSEVLGLVCDWLTDVVSTLNVFSSGRRPPSPEQPQVMSHCGLIVVG